MTTVKTYATRKCEHCFKRYQPEAGNQRWCTKCKPVAYKISQKARRKRSYVPKVRTPHRHDPRPCTSCGAEYTPTSPTQKWCSECSPHCRAKQTRAERKPKGIRLTRGTINEGKGLGLERIFAVTPYAVEMPIDRYPSIMGKVLAGGIVDGEEQYLIQLCETGLAITWPVDGVVAL